MKTIKQISIFLENQRGKLSDILTALKDQNIEIQAASVADTTEYGILRLITSDRGLYGSRNCCRYRMLIGLRI